MGVRTITVVKILSTYVVDIKQISKALKIKTKQVKRNVAGVEYVTDEWLGDYIRKHKCVTLSSAIWLIDYMNTHNYKIRWKIKKL
jgi:hypothetical protein